MGKQPRVVFDLSATKYMDCCVLSILVRQKHALGDRMHVVIPTGNSLARRLFEVTNLLGFFNSEATLADALAPKEPAMRYAISAQ